MLLLLRLVALYVVDIDTLVAYTGAFLLLVGTLTVVGVLLCLFLLLTLLFALALFLFALLTLLLFTLFLGTCRLIYCREVYLAYYIECGLNIVDLCKACRCLFLLLLCGFLLFYNGGGRRLFSRLLLFLYDGCV